MSEQNLLQLYGLVQNPFDVNYRKPLRPLQEESHLALYAKVEGFGVQQDSITSWVNQNRNVDGPTFILVHGPKGSGRTSVVNYIAYLFRHAEMKVDTISVKVEDHYNQSILKVR